MKQTQTIVLSLLLLSIFYSQEAPGSNNTPTKNSFEERTMDIGLSAAYWLEGTITVDGFDGTKDGSFLFRAFLDSYLMPKFAVGLYINFTPYTQDEVDITGIEFGVSFKPRFIINSKAAIKPGLNLGYRSLSADGFDSINGLAANISIEYQMMMEANIIHIEAGFLTQPAGGNADSDVTWGPTIYLGAGITL